MARVAPGMGRPTMVDARAARVRWPARCNDLPWSPSSARSGSVDFEHHSPPFVVRSDRGGRAAGEGAQRLVEALAAERERISNHTCVSRLLSVRARAFVPLRGASHFLLLAQEKVTKEKGTPDFPPRARSARGALRCSESVGRRELGHPWPRTCAPFPAGFLRYSAENERGFKARSQEPASISAAASLASLSRVWLRCARHQLSEAGVAVAPAVAPAVASAVAVGFQGPHRLVPSSGARAGGKARMFEHMDVRVRAGPVMVSSAGYRAGLFPRGARLGCPSLWLLSLGQARAEQERGRTPKAARRAEGKMPDVRESDSLPRRGAKAFDLDFDVAFAVSVPVAQRVGAQKTNHLALADQDPPYNSSARHQQANPLRIKRMPPGIPPGPTP